MLEAELSKDVKKAPVVEFEIPKKIFTKHDAESGVEDSLVVKLGDLQVRVVSRKKVQHNDLSTIVKLIFKLQTPSLTHIVALKSRPRSVNCHRIAHRARNANGVVLSYLAP